MYVFAVSFAKGLGCPCSCCLPVLAVSVEVFLAPSEFCSWRQHVEPDPLRFSHLFVRFHHCFLTAVATLLLSFGILLKVFFGSWHAFAWWKDEVLLLSICRFGVWVDDGVRDVWNGFEQKGLSAGHLEGDILRCTLHTVCTVGFLRVQSMKLKLTVPCSYLGSNL
jgi:hypothetical protein